MINTFLPILIIYSPSLLIYNTNKKVFFIQTSFFSIFLRVIKVFFFFSIFLVCFIVNFFIFYLFIYISLLLFIFFKIHDIYLNPKNFIEINEDISRCLFNKNTKEYVYYKGVYMPISSAEFRYWSDFLNNENPDWYILDIKNKHLLD